MSIEGAHLKFTQSFLDAFYIGKRKRLGEQYHGPKSGIPELPNVLLQCPNCAAPNVDYKINCEYCSSPLRITK